MVPPGLLGVHTQSLTVHHLVENLWGRENNDGGEEMVQGERMCGAEYKKPGAEKEGEHWGRKRKNGTKKNERDIDIYIATGSGSNEEMRDGRAMEEEDD